MIGTRSSGTMADAALRQQLGAGFDLLRQGRVVEAERASDELLARHARDPQVLFFASEVRLAAGAPESALPLISAAVDAAPGELMLRLKKAHNQIQLRRRNDARQTAADAAAIAGHDAKALWAVGRVYARCDDPVSARALYEKAVEAGCDDPALLYDLATVQFFSGDFESAETNLDALLAKAPKTGHALYLRSTLRRQTESRNHVVELEARLDEGFADTVGRSACLYALAKELEDLGQSERSFAALTEGAALKRRTLQYDAAAERDSIDAIRNAYTAKVMQQAVPGHDEAGAIFIVGMPRTGTTLVERMLGRHDEVTSAGELLDFSQALADAVRRSVAAQPGKSLVEASLTIDFAALGKDYMASARQAAAGSRLFIDKMPVNFIYCGMIRKALPKARIIHLVRDPMDSCYAVYKTLFNQAYHFSYDLDELGAYYATYHRLMQHWHAVMPGAILDVRYEDLVADFEGQARRILAWCSLDWQDAVLAPADNDQPSTTASAAQVREPVHARSVQKWRDHEVGLAALKAQLLASGIVDA